MGLKVIGAGLGRTGTLSLKQALETLGFGRCYHMLEVREHPEHRPIWSAAHRGEAVDWDALFAGYHSAVDWPACNLWRELAAYYPQAKVLLTVRDADKWYDSVVETIFVSAQQALASADPADRARGAWLSEVVWDRMFSGRMQDRAHVTSIFKAHIEEVVAAVPASRLLVFEASQGWAPLCAFLRRPIPDAPYPHVNTTDEFRGRFLLPAGEA